MILWKQRSERQTTFTEPWYSRLNRYAGRFLSTIVPLHATATRIMALLGKQRPAEFDQVRATLVGVPSLIFLPYYSLLAASGVYHTLQGLILALHRFQLVPASWYPKMVSSKIWYIVVGTIGAATLGGIYGFIANEGIPESAKHWTHELPGFLQSGNAKFL